MQHPSLNESTGHLLIDMVGDMIQTISDISRFYSQKPVLVGHSMGAKVRYF